MRRKIKELMNKEEGFTLVELLAVIVILGIIVAIAVPAIGSIMDDADKNADKANTELIIDAARLYDVKETIPTEGVTVQMLITAGYLDLRGNETEAILSNTVTKNADGGYTYSGDTTPDEDEL